MKDNISMVIATIVGVILLVLVPLLSILSRQDNMAYNVVLTLTTNFVDEVKSKGFIDRRDYQEYQEQISATGNLYDLQLEIYEKMVYQDSSGKNIQDMLLFNNKDLDDYFVLNSAYKLKIGDEFYIKIKNTNTPSSGLLYDFLIGTDNDKSKTIVDINYGGTINKVDLNEYEKVVSEDEHYPIITIGIPDDGKYYDMDSGKYKYPESTTDLNLQIKLENFTNFIELAGMLAGTLTDTLTNSIFKEYIDIRGIDEGDYTLNVGNPAKNGDVWDIDVNIHIDNPLTYEANIIVLVLPGLGTYNNQNISTGKESEIFCISDAASEFKLKINGPFYHNGRECIGDTFYVDISSTPTESPFFQIEYKNNTLSNIQSEIDNRFVFETISGNKISSENIPISADDGYIKEKIGFTVTGNDGYAKIDNAAAILGAGEIVESRKYNVGTDTDAPNGKIEVSSYINNAPIVQDSKYVISTNKVYIVLNSSTNLYTIKDSKSGLYKIKLSNNGTDYTDKEIDDSTTYVEWNISGNSQDKIYYKLEDNVGNESVTCEVGIVYTTGPKINNITVYSNQYNPIEKNKWYSLYDTTYGDYKLKVKVEVESNTDYTICTSLMKESVSLIDKQETVTSTQSLTNFEFDMEGLVYDNGSGQKYKVKVIVTGGGKTVTQTEQVYNFDHEIPTITSVGVIVTPDDEAGGWYKQIKLKTEATDKYSSLSIFHSFNHGVNYQETNVDGLLIDAAYKLEGKDIEIETKVVDEAGNVATTKNYKNIDQVGPKITLMRTTQGYEIKVEDNASGVDGIYFNVGDMYGLRHRYFMNAIGKEQDQTFAISDTITTKIIIKESDLNNYFNKEKSRTDLINDYKKIFDEATAESMADNEVSSIEAFDYFVAEGAYINISAKDKIGNVSEKRLKITQDAVIINIQSGLEETDKNGIWTDIQFDSAATNGYSQYCWSDSNIPPTDGWKDYTFNNSSITNDGKTQYISANIDIMENRSIGEKHLHIRAKNNKDSASELWTYGSREFTRSNIEISVSAKSEVSDYYASVGMEITRESEYKNKGYKIDYAVNDTSYSVMPTTFSNSNTLTLDGNLENTDRVRLSILKPTQSNSCSETVFMAVRVMDKVGNVGGGFNYSIVIRAPHINQVVLRRIAKDTTYTQNFNNEESSPEFTHTYGKLYQIIIELPTQSNSIQFISAGTQEDFEERKVTFSTVGITEGDDNHYTIDRVVSVMQNVGHLYFVVRYNFKPDPFSELQWTTTRICYNRNLLVK